MPCFPVIPNPPKCIGAATRHRISPRHHTLSHSQAEPGVRIPIVGPSRTTGEEMRLHTFLPFVFFVTAGLAASGQPSEPGLAVRELTSWGGYALLANPCPAGSSSCDNNSGTCCPDGYTCIKSGDPMCCPSRTVTPLFFAISLVSKSLFATPPWSLSACHPRACRAIQTPRANESRVK